MDLFNQGNPDNPNELIRRELMLPDADVVLYEQFFNKSESDKLFKNLSDNIKWKQDKIKFYGKQFDVPRLAAWYGEDGFSYTYSGIQMHPNPWNEDLMFIKEKIEKVSKVSFSSCLLNLYRTGRDSVNWHQDNEKELGQNPIIGSVSFGETRPFQMKHISRTELKKVDIPLTNGSFLLMKGTTQHFWKHQIPKTTRKLNPRINLTFRIIKDVRSNPKG